MRHKLLPEITSWIRLSLICTFFSSFTSSTTTLLVDTPFLRISESRGPALQVQQECLGKDCTAFASMLAQPAMHSPVPFSAAPTQSSTISDKTAERPPEIVVAGVGEALVHLIVHSHLSLKVVGDIGSVPTHAGAAPASINSSGVLDLFPFAGAARIATVPSSADKRTLIIEAKQHLNRSKEALDYTPTIARRGLAYMLLSSNRVFRLYSFVLRAGERTEMHSLPNPGVAIFLSDAQVRSIHQEVSLVTNK